MSKLFNCKITRPISMATCESCCKQCIVENGSKALKGRLTNRRAHGNGYCLKYQILDCEMDSKVRKKDSVVGYDKFEMVIDILNLFGSVQNE
ncbi:hypothetical protein GJ496_000350 [Pomphorhynchus laevis]|nr:hypothetical protein GJ496_000350 [Pomphorhynchus laevis]